MFKKLILIFLFFGLVSSVAKAQSGLQVNANTATLNYPKAVEFHLSIASQSPIQKAYLLYGTNLHSCAASSARQSLNIEPGTSQTLDWKWDLEKSNNLPPGGQVWWQWELHDSAGNTLLTDKQTLNVEDPNYKWKKLSKANVTVYWIKGKDSFGKFLLDTAINSIERLSRKAGIQTGGDIRLMIYPDVESMLKAALGLPGWAGGVTFPEYNSILIAIPPNATLWASQVIPHELAHLITQQLIFNCMGIDIPTWLSEGLSGYSEGQASRRDLSTLKAAFKSGDVPRLRDLAHGFYGERERINISYIASHVVVTYLIEIYGPEKMAALLERVKSGNNIDEALMAVYHFDTDGLDDEWRASMGYKSEQSTAASIPKSIQNTPVPTLVPWTPVAPQLQGTSAPAP